MKGSVTVIQHHEDGSEEVILQESNLIVDGGGESIAEMMSVPSSTLGYAPRVMDASNWSFAAITFSPAKDSFGQPTYADASCADGSRELISANASYVTAEAIADPSSWINIGYAQNTLRVLNPTNSTLTATSGYDIPKKLPSYPDPMDTDLEPKAQYQYATVSGDGQTFFGHHENRVYWDTNPSSLTIGAFAPKTTGKIENIYFVSSLDADFSGTPEANVEFSAGGSKVINTSNFNGRGSVDKHGFVSIQHEDDSTYGEGFAGAAFYRGTEATSSLQITNGYVEIYSLIHASDIRWMAVYGGIHHIGLWVYDNKESLKNQTPPYDLTPDSNGETGLRYRLFAKKTFTENLCARDRFDTMGTLTFRWRIDFRS
jgi:hypothetical protein